MYTTTSSKTFFEFPHQDPRCSNLVLSFPTPGLLIRLHTRRSSVDQHWLTQSLAPIDQASIYFFHLVNDREHTSVSSFPLLLLFLCTKIDPITEPLPFSIAHKSTPDTGVHMHESSSRPVGARSKNNLLHLHDHKQNQNRPECQRNRATASPAVRIKWRWTE